MDRQDELKIFRRFNSVDLDEIVGHSNTIYGNTRRAGLFSQGVQEAKLRDVVKEFGTDVTEYSGKIIVKK